MKFNTNIAKDMPLECNRNIYIYIYQFYSFFQFTTTHFYFKFGEQLLNNRLLMVSSQAVPLFLSELAPAKFRGALNILFQLDITIGIFIANIVNYFALKIHPWGWRLSLGLTGAPASILCLGSFAIPETPSSLIEHGKLDEGLKMLKKVRGEENVEAEFEELKQASKLAQQVKHPYRMLMKRPSRPPLAIGILMQIFQQFTGINAIVFYATVLFQTVGFKSNKSLLSSVIIGIVNVFSTLISMFSVDRAGRRVLLLSACFLMFVAQVSLSC